MAQTTNDQGPRDVPEHMPSQLHDLTAVITLARPWVILCFLRWIITVALMAALGTASINFFAKYCIVNSSMEEPPLPRK